MVDYREKRGMIITTTPLIEGYEVSNYLGIVTGETILGANFIKDIFASFTDFFGGRSNSYEKELARAREMAFEEMSDAARSLGANAILSVDIDYETIGKSGSMLMVAISGTAVQINRK